ncbi:MAG: hypothetical protein IKV12_05585 [Alistipes sp.]|nr:hypothetical protein [Alistipes sp.]
MKKILLSISLILAAAAIVGCSQQAKWDHHQKQAMRENLRQYRDMIYLEDLTEPEFIIFTDSVTGNIEEVYPVYATFMQIPNVDDTIDMFVITTIVEELNEDAHNMRHIFPYRYLVSQGMLPDKLSHEQQRAFYNCLAQKVNNNFASVEQFLNAILADTSANSQITQFQRECANELFNWVIEVDEVITTQ